MPYFAHHLASCTPLHPYVTLHFEMKATLSGENGQISAHLAMCRRSRKEGQLKCCTSSALPDDMGSVTMSDSYPGNLFCLQVPIMSIDVPMMSTGGHWGWGYMCQYVPIVPTGHGVSLFPVPTCADYADQRCGGLHVPTHADSADQRWGGGK